MIKSNNEGECGMLKKNEIKLKDKLRNIIKEIGYMEDIKQKIVAEFQSRNMSGLRAAWVFTENLDLNTLSDSEEDLRFLFIFTMALNKALKEKNIEIPTIDVKEFFTQAEINRWKNYKENKPQDNIYPLVFKKVQQVGDKIWQTVMTAQELIELDKDNLLIYNFKTQRNPKVTAMGLQINIDKQKVYEIKERLLNGQQYPDPIILNILNNGESQVVYDEREETLVIHEGSIINIIDGFHRKTATALALKENPDLNFKWQVTFTFLTEEAAHDYMVQKDKQKPMKREWIQQKDYTKPENLVVSLIAEDRLSELAKVMKDDEQYIKLNRALTKKSIIAQAVKECYGDQLGTSSNIRKVAQWIVEFTDYLMGLYEEEFITNPYEIKQKSVINHKNMFYGYIALSAKLQNDSQWKEKVKQKMETIDFSVENPLWRDLGLVNNNKDANKTLRVKLYNLFKEGL